MFLRQFFSENVGGRLFTFYFSEQNAKKMMYPSNFRNFSTLQVLCSTFNLHILRLDVSNIYMSPI